MKINFEQDNSQVRNAKLTFADTQESADVLTKLSLKRVEYVCAGRLKVQRLKEHANSVDLRHFTQERRNSSNLTG